ncbi:MAG: hypothetical protein R3174_08480 [Gammaproteobacteria bacterium]|nr:hypothetical protein [Gammaproteobacteria bacterium]
MGIWFSFNHARGQAISLVLEYLHIQDYATAICLVGEREVNAKSDRGNQTDGMYFEHFHGDEQSGCATPAKDLTCLRTSSNK